ncbi:hypothetical protein M885DRAFT_558310 [Pelagophyceae sp. CCMP2097]|nr:hypothetical protein M885DRAFT_558310 [Pelagophyceae sp. CCMP2097]
MRYFCALFVTVARGLAPPLRSRAALTLWSQPDLDNHADQMNPNNDEYKGDDGTDDRSQADLDDYSNQCNPNNDDYHG